MPEKPQLTVYTLDHCPNCEILKDFLRKSDHAFAECDLSTAESLTELRLNGVFVSEAPVLQKGDDFLTSADLFSKGRIDSERITRLIAGV